MSEIDEIFKKIQSHKGVKGVICVNTDGVAIKTTLDNSTTVHYASVITTLVSKAKTCVTQMDNSNDLTFIRVRTKKDEIMIAPSQGPAGGQEPKYTLIVIQNASEDSA